MDKQPTLKITLLGGVSLELDGHRIGGFSSRKAEALFIYALHQERPLSRDVLANLLWDDRSQDQALANLRSTLSSLKRKLGDYLIITRHHVAINREQPCQMDTTLFSELANSQEEASWQAASDLYRGPFLSGFHLRGSRDFEEWAAIEREKLRRLAQTVLENISRRQTDRGDFKEALENTTRLLELDPYYEAGRRQMMTLLVRDRRRTAALAQYKIGADILEKELGILPARATTELFHRIRDAEPEQHNLSPEVTPFVGRETELGRLFQWFAGRQRRLVTLVGPGGIGKSRLALKTAEEQCGRFLDGVFLVPLVSLEPGDHATPEEVRNLIAAAIAEALGLRLSVRATHEAELLDYLRSRELLLVLDNFEHVMAANGLLVDLLQTAVDVTLLVTSRTRLNLRQEQLLELHGLERPAHQTDIVHSDAGQLFIQVAQRHVPGLELRETNLGAVTQICRLTRGLPLAIELAASWSRLLNPVEIAAEIERSLTFLSASLPDLPQRHQSMQAVFDSSWRLLAGDERRAFQRLAVFRGDFSRQAAEEVAGYGRETLLALVDKSLIRRSHTIEHGLRFEIHDLLHHFAAAKLALDEAEQRQIRDEHCQFFARLLQGQKVDLLDGSKAQPLETLEVDLENALDAWRWALSQGYYEQLDGMVSGIYLIFDHRGWFQEGVNFFGDSARQLEEKIKVGDSAGERVLSRVLGRYGRLLFSLGHHEEAERQFQSSLEIVRRLEVNDELSFCLSMLGAISHVRGNFDEASAYAREGVAVAGQIDDASGMAFCQNLLGVVAQARGKYDAAADHFRENLRLRRSRGDTFGEAIALNNLGNVAQAQSEYEQAKRLYEESQAIFDRIGHQFGRAAALGNAGYVAWRLGAYEEAAQLHQSALAVKRQLGHKRSIALTLANLGQVAFSQQHHDAAREYFHESLQLAQETEALPLILDLLVSLSELEVESGTGEVAWQLLHVATKHPSLTQETASRIDDLRPDLEASLTAASRQEIEQNAAGIPLEDLVVSLLSP